jgi:hypothetical protein
MIKKNKIVKHIIFTFGVVLGLFIYERASNHSIDKLITSIFCKRLSTNLAQSVFGEIYIIIGKETYISKIRYLASKTASSSEEKFVSIKTIIDVKTFTMIKAEPSILYFNDLNHEYIFYDTESSFIIAYPKFEN